MQEELLFEYCTYYGVEPDDISLLLDYGYTADEIEEMLVDYDLICEIVHSIKGEETYNDYLIEF